jgi:uncharacterized protein YwgA
MSNPDAQSLPIENSLDLLLVLLYAPGARGERAKPIEGITRLQKLMFLLQQGEGPGDLVETAKKELQFRAYKMGPYDEGIREDLDNLVSLGLVQTKRLRYLITDDADQSEAGVGPEEISESARKVESSSYELTDIGVDVAKQLWDGMTKQATQELAKFKEFFGSLSLRQLLIFVYEKYPAMTEKSEIRGQLGL